MAQLAMARNPLIAWNAAALLVASLMAGPGYALAPSSLDGSPDALRAAWATLSDARTGIAFKEPLHLESAQDKGELTGALYGIVERPFGQLERELAARAGWCAVLILDPNVHRCQPTGEAARAAQIEVAFGETDMPVAFSFRPGARSDDYLQVRMTADSGPFGIRDFVIALEATPLAANRTLVHLTFSQRFGIASRIAARAYFNTVGRGKVGFTVIDRDAAGRPIHVGDLRGGLERNLIRYYYAILAYFDSLSVPRDAQPDRRVRTWLAYTQRYPLQLREEAGYLERKLPDVRGQHASG